MSYVTEISKGTRRSNFSGVAYNCLEDIRVTQTGQQDMSIVGEAHDGLEAIELIQARVPNVIILDLVMPSL